MFHYLPQLRQLTMRLQKPQPAVRSDEMRCITCSSSYLFSEVFDLKPTSGV